MWDDCDTCPRVADGPNSNGLPESILGVPRLADACDPLPLMRIEVQPDPEDIDRVELELFGPPATQEIRATPIRVDDPVDLKVVFRTCSCIKDGVKRNEWECAHHLCLTPDTIWTVEKGDDPWFPITVEDDHDQTVDEKDPPFQFPGATQSFTWSWGRDTDMQGRPVPSYENDFGRGTYGLIASFVTDHVPEPITIAHRLFQTPWYRAVSLADRWATGCWAGPKCSPWLLRWEDVIRWPDQMSVVSRIYDPVLLGTNEFGGDIVTREGLLQSGVLRMSRQVREILLMADEWMFVSPGETPAELAKLKSMVQFVAVPRDGTARGRPAVVEVMGDTLEVRGDVNRLWDWTEAAGALRAHPGTSIVYSARFNRLYLLSSGSNGRAGEVLAFDLQNDRFMIAPTELPAAGEVLAATLAGTDLFALQVDEKGMATLVRRSLDGHGSDIVWRVPYTGKFQVWLAAFATKDLAMVVAEDESYTVYQLEEGVFVQIYSGTGSVIDAPGLGTSGLLLPVSGSGGDSIVLIEQHPPLERTICTSL